MDKKILSTGAIFGIIAIILGAFGAHALKKSCRLKHLSLLKPECAIKCIMPCFYCSLEALNDFPQKTKKSIWFLIVLGVIFFSGSIYLLATNSLTSFDFKVIGFVTPIGGLLLILGWSVLLFHFLKKKTLK